MNLLRPVGLRLTVFDTYLQIEKGKLRKLDVRLMHGYVEQDRLPSFLAGAFTAGNLNRWVDWQAVYQHPNLLVWSLRLVPDATERSLLTSHGKQAEKNLSEGWHLISPALRDFTSAVL